MVTANAVQPKPAHPTATVPPLPTTAVPAVMAAAGSVRVLPAGRTELPAAIVSQTVALVPVVQVAPVNPRPRLPVLLPELPAFVLP